MTNHSKLMIILICLNPIRGTCVNWAIGVKLGQCEGTGVNWAIGVKVAQ